MTGYDYIPELDNKFDPDAIGCQGQALARERIVSYTLYSLDSNHRHSLVRDIRQDVVLSFFKPLRVVIFASTNIATRFFMANGKHISQDELQFIVDVESSKAQQKIHKFEKEGSKLRSENKQRLNQMIQLEAQGKENTSGYKALQKEYKDTGNKIRDLTTKIGEQTSKLKVNYFTMNQLKKQAKQLQKDLDNTVKSLHPEEYANLEQRLKAVQKRMTELKSDAKSYKVMM